MSRLTSRRRRLQIVEEWRHKADDLQSELDAAQRDARNQSMEAHRLRTNQDSLNEQVEGLRRENKSLAQEVRDHQESLAEGKWRSLLLSAIFDF